MDKETKDFFKIFEKSKFKINPFTNKKINPNGEKANELRLYFSKRPTSQDFVIKSI